MYSLSRKLFLLSIVLFLGLGSFCQQKAGVQPYPKIVGYASVVHPIVSIDKNKTTFNFTNSYTVGFPFGLNLLKSDRYGFSFELVPFIKAENGTSRVYNFLFHPGLMCRYKNGFTIISRVALETGGRYGFTENFSKVFFKKDNVSYFVAMPLLLRFGNNLPPSVGTALQIGISF
ncbi:MAG TPA: hypothetical protein PLP23_04555 [Panacibacter sp.]|nr:hypothetical protein [Panacibacter sp.]